MNDEGYVQQDDGGYWVQDTRVSLDSVIAAFHDGLSPETIAAECLPVLTLEQVYGALAYYLRHRPAVDAYLAADEGEYEAFRRDVRARYPQARRLDALRQSTGTLQS